MFGASTASADGEVNVYTYRETKLVQPLFVRQHDAGEIDVGAAAFGGRITLVASAHGFFSGSLFIISAQ